MKKISIGTRGSQLALVQANNVKAKIANLYPDMDIQLVVIKTTGDKILDRNLTQIGGKGLFIKEIEEHLLAGKIDIAVHSMKDLPAIIPNQLAITCILEREDVRDALLCANHKSITDLPQGSVFGTSSPRRAAQILNKRADLKISQFRGNVQTRLNKLQSGLVEATFLAMAGLNRLNIKSDMITPLEIEEFLPAVAQGAVGIEIKKDNLELFKMLQPLNDEITSICVNVERAFLACFEGSCHTPLAAYAQINDSNFLDFKCNIAKPDGSLLLARSFVSHLNDAINKAIECANDLKQEAGEGFFDI